MNRRQKIIDLKTFKVYPSLSSLAKEINMTVGGLHHILLRNHNLRKNKFFRKRYEYFDIWLESTEKEKMQYVKGENIYFYQPWERAD